MGTCYSQALGFWMDGQGATFTSFTTIADQETPPPGDVLALIAAMKGTSTCALLGAAVQYAVVLDEPASSGPFATVADRAVFQTRYEDSRQNSRVEIPGPKEGIFLPGHRLVDMSNPLVVTLVEQLLAVAGDREGRPVVTVGQGRRQFVNRGPF